MIEIMVGMVILSIGLLGAAGMTVAAARRASGLSTQSSRDGVMLQELNKLAALPYDSLTPRAGCSTASTGTNRSFDAISAFRLSSPNDGGASKTMTS